VETFLTRDLVGVGEIFSGCPRGHDLQRDMGKKARENRRIQGAWEPPCRGFGGSAPGPPSPAGAF